MEVYIFLISIVLILYPISKKIGYMDNGLKVKMNSKLYTIIIAAMLTVILGLRGLTVGIDTVNYYNSFMRYQNMSLSNALEGVFYEYGYRLFQYFVGIIFQEYQFLLIIVAIFYISVLSFHIHKHSKNPTFSYVLFILYGFYTFAFSTTRQTIAIAFIMIAYEFISRKQLHKFIIFNLLAASFHVTSLVFIPSYWITKFKINKFTIFFLTMTVGLSIYFSNYIIRFLNTLARNELSFVETDGNLMFLFMIISTLIGIVYKRQFLAGNPNNRFLFYMMCLSVVIMPITRYHPAMMRLFYYFFIFMITYVPNLLSSIKDPMIRNVGYIGYFITGVIFFFTNVIPNARLENYLFFWQ